MFMLLGKPNVPLAVRLNQQIEDIKACRREAIQSSAVSSSVRLWQFNFFSETFPQSVPTYLQTENCEGLNYFLACLG